MVEPLPMILAFEEAKKKNQQTKHRAMPMLQYCRLSLVPRSGAVGIAGSCVGLQNKTGQPAYRPRRLMQVPVLSGCGIL